MSTVSSEVAQYKGLVGPLRHRCAQCLATGPQLLRCSGCRAVHYCSREHQVADRPRHKSDCNGVKKARVKLAKEDHLVRNAEEDFMTPANAFKTNVSEFWSIASTRDYMRARFDLADRLRLIGTLDSVQEALGHMQDMLWLCRSDNLGLREMWWETCDPAGDYDWGDPTLPFLDLRGQDVLEAPKFFRKYSSLNNLVAVMLLKLKLLVDIRNLKITRKILNNRRLPVELWVMIELAVVRSPLASKVLLGQSPESLNKTEMTLLDQIRQFGAIIVGVNENFMFSLFDPDSTLRANPSSYSRGSWEEMALSMQFSYATWWETEGVLDLLKDARACAARDSEDEIEDMRQAQIKKKAPGYQRTAEELLEDVSVNRIWGYLDYAVENASYLGPWSERPSERHTAKHKKTAKAMVEEDEESDSSFDETIYASI